MNVKEFLILIEVASNAAGVMKRMATLSRPDYVGAHAAPADLNGLTMGQLMELQGVKTVADCIFIPPRVILGMEREEVMATKVDEIFGLANWASEEMKRIAKLFEATSVPTTPEEEKAGIGKLSFGMFGLLDYYAQRMGITDHAEVERVPWVRVYKCMEMDAERIKFDRRLRKIYQEQSNIPRRR